MNVVMIKIFWRVLTDLFDIQYIYNPDEYLPDLDIINAKDTISSTVSVSSYAILSL